MSIQSAALFDQDGKPTYTLVSRVKAKAAARSLQPAVRCVDENGEATAYFRAWWSVALPTRNPLPDEPLADRDGVGTPAFWQVFT